MMTGSDRGFKLVGHGCLLGTMSGQVHFSLQIGLEVWRLVAGTSDGAFTLSLTPRVRCRCRRV